ncbi:hypothetical protein C0J52_07130 [Blattella germanica]|nr:hypothetical protein C0J52_07130 [Blattella germanica]
MFVEEKKNCTIVERYNIAFICVTSMKIKARSLSGIATIFRDIMSQQWGKDRDKRDREGVNEKEKGDGERKRNFISIIRTGGVVRRENTNTWAFYRDPQHLG